VFEDGRMGEWSSRFERLCNGLDVRSPGPAANAKKIHRCPFATTNARSQTYNNLNTLLN
jgi:hypothetical protein